LAQVAGAQSTSGAVSWLRIRELEANPSANPLSPRGVINHSGLTAAPNLGANGGTPTFDNLNDMVGGLRAVNAPFNRPGWIFNPRTLNTLENVKDGQQHYLADAGLLTFDATGGGSTLLGF
jgi:HK97 family phage major capsid protein